MTVLRTVAEVRSALRGKSKVGFVPTMGAFHQGHLELMRRSRSECDTTVVSLFVNPMQFGPNEDFDKYPRDEAGDIELASGFGVDYLFAPEAKEILLGRQTTVQVKGVSETWEGRSRPGHFPGVATIVLKLLNIVEPDVAYFGLKDLQQCAVVTTMVRDLNLDIELRLVETVRDGSGLALSSRNQRLSPEALILAPFLYKTLQSTALSIQSSPKAVRESTESCKSKLVKSGFLVDYVELVEAHTMEPLSELQKGARLIAAVILDGVRLIDNVAVAIQ